MTRLSRTALPGICFGILFISAAPRTEDSSSGELLRYEEARLQAEGRKLTKLSRGGRFGSDPFRIRYLEELDRYLILLRGRSQVLLTDGAFNPIDRQAAPRSPTGWSLGPNGHVFIGGEHSGEVALYRVTSEKLLPRGKLAPLGVTSIRDLAYLPSHRNLFLLDPFERRLVRLALDPEWPEQDPVQFTQETWPSGAGALQIRYLENHLLINLLLEHTLLIVPLAKGRPDFSLASRISHDGPIWAFDAVVRNKKLLVAAAGVEDRPLNRLGGEFGHIDSFLFVYEVPWDPESGAYRRPLGEHAPARRILRNLSHLDVVTPKAVRFEALPNGALRLWVSAFGSAKLASFKLEANRLHDAGSFSVPPGTTDFTLPSNHRRNGAREMGRCIMLFANSLFDGIYSLEPAARTSEYKRVLAMDTSPSGLSWQSRLGELLFFTTLIAPRNKTEAELSRFTCEACHYEGAVDGRVHYTGRGHVFATTKPLFGLANNVPLFSRAGDKSLASMVQAEFRAANQGRRDIFSLDTKSLPRLKEVDGLPPVLGPRDLRVAFLSFFFEFRHRPNPWRVQGDGLSPLALKGLAVFRDRCEYCHRAVESTRMGRSLPFKEWSQWLEAAGRDLVWGAPFYAKTGIQPYVHRAGARVPSLRRIWQKFPYFTNGSSPTLSHLLSRFRYRDLTAWHHFDPVGNSHEPGDVKRLTQVEIQALEELLRHF